MENYMYAKVSKKLFSQVWITNYYLAQILCYFLRKTASYMYSIFSFTAFLFLCIMHFFTYKVKTLFSCTLYSVAMILNVLPQFYFHKLHTKSAKCTNISKENFQHKKFAKNKMIMILYACDNERERVKSLLCSTKCS